MDDRARGWERRFEIPLLVAALLVVPALVLEESGVGEPWATFAGVLDWGIWLAFAIEVAVMVWVVPARGEWLRRHPIELAIVVFTIPLLPAALQALRVGRLLRLVRLFRLLPLVRGAVASRRVFSLDGLRWAGVLVAVTIVGGGTALAAVERQHSAWDGVWWAITTATTVGYGDVSPTTTAGRSIAIVVMIVSIGFVAMLTGALAQRFAAANQADLEEAVTDVRIEEDETLRELTRVRERLTRLEDAIRQRK